MPKSASQPHLLSAAAAGSNVQSVMSSALFNSVRRSEAARESRHPSLLLGNQRKSAQLPQILLDQLMGSRSSRRAALSENIVPDAALIQDVRLDGRTYSEDEAASVDKSEAKEQTHATTDSNRYWVSDQRWRDNRFAMHGTAWQGAQAMARGPGGAYQASYVAYCGFATVSLVLLSASLLLLGVPLLLTQRASLASYSSAGRLAEVKRTVACASIAAVAAATGAVVCLFAGLLVRALSAWRFACLCCDPRHGGRRDLDSGQPSLPATSSRAWGAKKF